MSAKLFLLLEDGTKIEMKQTDSIGVLLHRIQHKDIEAIVAGDISSQDRLLWEKQFKACDVMPREFLENTFDGD